jgi:hypothetical protein
MAVSENATVGSRIAGSTFSTGDLYKGVVINSSGHVVVPDTTGNILAAGVLYGRTGTTSGAGSEVVPVATAGVVKVRMAASTLSAGDVIGFSTAGLGIAPTTDAYVFGEIVYGSSGTTGRVVSVQVIRGPLGTP